MSPLRNPGKFSPMPTDEKILLGDQEATVSSCPDTTGRQQYKGKVTIGQEGIFQSSVD